MIREGVVNTNTGTEHAQKTEDTKQRIVENPLRFSVAGADMSNLRNLKQPEGTPPDNKEKAKQQIDEGRGGFFGYSSQVQQYVKQAKTDTPGEKTQEETKRANADKAKELQPAIIPSDFPSFNEAVAVTNIQLSQTMEVKQETTGTTMHQDRSTVPNSMMYEASGANKNDEIAALMTMMAPIWEAEKEKQEKKKKSAESASPSGMSMSSYMGPSEALHNIAQNAVRAARLRHEIMEHQNKLLELHAVKVQLLARLTAMEGEIFTQRVYKAMRQRADIFDSGVYERSTHRGRDSKN